MDWSGSWYCSWSRSRLPSWSRSSLDRNCVRLLELRWDSWSMLSARVKAGFRSEVERDVSNLGGAD